MEFEAGALVYTLLGAIVAYAVNGLFVGFRPLFEVPTKLVTPGAAVYGWYVPLGVACGLVATILPMAFYGIRDAFRMIPFPPHFKPAIGGLGVGLIALALPQLLGGGYAWIQSAINNSIPTRLLLFLAFGKIVTFALTIGSGGSGGVFAPTLFTGAMIGAFLSQIFHQPAAAFAVVGMAAVFGAAARVPIATLLMVTEMTGGYHLLVPAALAVILSSVVQTFLSTSLKYSSLYEAQVPSRPFSPSHYAEHVRIALDLLRTHTKSSADDGLELISLLSTGVPVHLTHDRQLRIIVIEPKTGLVGRTVKDGCIDGASGDVEVILLLRSNHLLWPHQHPELKAGDQIVTAASDRDWAESLKLLKESSPPAEAALRLH
jgi:CIC family chloride channel protein